MRKSTMFVIMLLTASLMLSSVVVGEGENNQNETEYYTIGTNKSTYCMGEYVVISYFGIDSPYGPKSYRLYITNQSEPNTGIVFQSHGMIELAVWVPQTGVARIAWNQSYQVFSEFGDQVPPGKYYAWYGVQTKHGPAEFEIADIECLPVTVATYKYTYSIGEPVKITASGYLPRDLWDVHFAITDEQGNFVVEPSTINPGKIYTGCSDNIFYSCGGDNREMFWIWDQTYRIGNGYPVISKYGEEKGEQVLAGKYNVWVAYNKSELAYGPAEFEIVDSPEPNIPNANEGSLEPIIGAAHDDDAVGGDIATDHLPTAKTTSSLPSGASNFALLIFGLQFFAFGLVGYNYRKRLKRT
jgi:hypothetical protein